MSKTPEEVGEELGINKSEVQIIKERLSKCLVKGSEAGKQLRAVLGSISTPSKSSRVINSLIQSYLKYNELRSIAGLYGIPIIEGERSEEIEAKINKYKRGDYNE